MYLTIAPVGVVHRRAVDESICQIGKIVAESDGEVALLEIDPDAAWDDAPSTYSLSEIPRIDFDGRCEEALTRMGGDPPPLNCQA